MIESRWWLAGALLAACTQVIDHGDSPLVGEILEDCIVPVSRSDSLRVSPISLEFGSASLWLWQDASAIVTSFEDVCGRHVLEISPTAPVPLTRAELDWNATATDWVYTTAPLGGFVAGGVGHLYYRVLRFRSAAPFFYDPVGVGVCTMELKKSAQCDRSSPLLWTGAESWGGDGFVDPKDGYAYVISCRPADSRAPQLNTCSVARVDPALVDRPEAYQFATGPGTFTSDSTQAVVTLDAPVATVSYNPTLGSYILVFSDPARQEVRFGLSTSPTGPLNDQGTILTTVPADYFSTDGGRQHAALGHGNVIAVSYNPFTFQSGMAGIHLASFRLARRVPH